MLNDKITSASLQYPFLMLSLHWMIIFSGYKPHWYGLEGACSTYTAKLGWRGSPILYLIVKNVLTRRNPLISYVCGFQYTYCIFKCSVLAGCSTSLWLLPFNPIDLAESQANPKPHVTALLNWVSLVLISPTGKQPPISGLNFTHHAILYIHSIVLLCKAVRCHIVRCLPAVPPLVLYKPSASGESSYVHRLMLCTLLREVSICYQYVSKAETETRLGTEVKKVLILSA